MLQVTVTVYSYSSYVEVEVLLLLRLNLKNYLKAKQRLNNKQVNQNLSDRRSLKVKRGKSRRNEEGQHVFQLEARST